ncbi:alpha/beta hydrolase [Uliginosibacterium flavum]|uniref:Alpha/beta hydrolase n=1 Tax=Uliginosibacterium flavum TaxID=1396831 RepID=A0ABV2TJN2_9RHOO
MPTRLLDALPAAFPIWPDAPPGGQPSQLQESASQKPGNILSVRGVSIPTLTPFLPEHPNGSSIIVIPGGAYSQLVFDKEGSEIALWLNQYGITAFVLKHRLPVEGHADDYLVALQDVQRAIRLTRAHSKDLGLDASKIGVLGASSGGHLAATAGTRFSSQCYTPVDQIDSFSARPDFMLLLYGAYTGNMAFNHASGEQLFFPEAVKNRLYAEFIPSAQVSADTPPALLIAAGNDDRVSPENSTALFLALHQAGVPAQLQIFDDGGHGFALRSPDTCTFAAWPAACIDWLRRHELISAN